MTVKNRGFRLFAALMAAFILLTSCPLTALAGEETLLMAYYFYDEERDEEHGDTVYTDVVYNEPVVIEAAEGLYRSVIEFENCTFNEGITVNTAGEVIVFFRGDCEIKENDEGDRVINVIGTDFDVLAEGGCIAEFHNAPSGTFFHSENSRLFADSDVDAMCAMEKFEDYCFFLDGAELYAAMPGFSFSTDVYFEEINGEGVLKKNLTVTCASEVRAENCFFNEFDIGIADVIPDEGEELPCPVLNLIKNNGDDIFVRTRHFNGFNVEELPEDYVPAMLKLTGEIGGDLRLSGTVDLSELSFDYESGMIGIDSFNEYNRIDLGDHFALITGGDPFCSLEVFLGEEGKLIDVVGLSDLRVFRGDVFLNADGAHIFGSGSVYIPGIREDVDYKLFYNGVEVPFTKEIIPEDNKTHLNVEYEDVPEDIVIGDEKFCTAYLMDIGFSEDSFVSVPVRHKSIVKAEPNGARYNHFYFGEPLTVFANCEEDYACVDFNDCTFADGADITVIPGKTQIDVNFCGEIQMEDEDGEPILFAVKTDDSRYLFNSGVSVNDLPSGFVIGDTECGHFGVNGIAPGFVFNRNGVELSFGGAENVWSGFYLNRNCNAPHDYEEWEDYPPHDDCAAEEQSLGIFIRGSAYEPAPDAGYAEVTGSVSGVDAFEIRGRVDISGLSVDGTQIIYRAEGEESSLKTGSNDVTVLPAENDAGDFTVYAGEGANVVCPSYILDKMTLYANGEDVLSLDGVYTENGDVYIPRVNADGTDYYVFADGDMVFGNEGDEPEFSDGTTVLRIPDEKKADGYEVSAWLNGAGLSTDCYAANTVIATESGTFIEGAVFSGEVNIVTLGDQFNDWHSGVIFRDCTFEDGTFINFTANDNQAFIRFEGETNVGESCYVCLRTDDDELKYGVNWTDVCVENAPSGFGYLCDELDVNIGGESENDNYNICGAVVSTGNAENKWFNIRFRTTWYDENAIGKVLELKDNITGVEYIQSEEEDCPAINEFCFNGVYVSEPTVDLQVENRTGEYGMIRVRTSSPDPDEPWDVENWEMSGWNTDSHAVITGDIFGFDLETTGSADISELDFDYGTEDCPTEIFIGVWNPVNYMNIGSQRVNISGGSEFPVCITAEDGAFIREDEQWQTVIINGGDESIVDLSSAHIFGSGDYGVYIGKVLSEEELASIRLFCCSDEPNTYEYETCPEENKTHLYPNTEEYYDGDIGNWYLECASGGITVRKKIVHKTWLCDHENKETHFIDGMERPTCEHGGYVFYICPDCEQMWWSYEEMRSENGEHTSETLEGFAATCTENGLTDGEVCSVCGEVLTEQEILPAAGHTFERDEARDIKNTCTENGLEAYTCSCGETNDIVIFASGHNVVKLVGKAPTCTEDGLTTGAKCSKCETVLIEQTKIEKLGHKAVTLPAVAATCTEDGKTEGSKCSVCGEILTAQQTVKATGHKEVVLEAIAPTCITEGRTEGKYCSVCHTLLVIPQPVGFAAHTPVKDNAVAPTCTAKGLTEGEHCLVCDTVLKKQQNVPATGHTWDKGKVTKAATCKEDGVMSFKCSECGATKTESIPKLTTHTYNAGKVTKTATCKEAGVKTFTCTVCGATKTEPIAKLTTHTYKDGKCTVCGAADPNYDPTPAFRKGDVDNDGKVTAADARLALRASVGFKGDKDNDGKVIDWTDKTSRAFLAGNVDLDEKMTAADARLILRASVGLEKF